MKMERNCCMIGVDGRCTRSAQNLREMVQVKAAGEVLANVPFTCFIEAVNEAGGLLKVPGANINLSTFNGTLDLDKFEERGGTEMMAIQLARFFGKEVREHLFPTKGGRVNYIFGEYKRLHEPMAL